MRRWLPPSLIALAVLASAAVYSRLPARLPIHWDIAGRPNGWAPRAIGAFAFPTFALLLWLVVMIVPRIDPRRANIAKFRPSYDRVMAVVIASLLVVHVLVLGVALGWSIPVPSVSALAMGILFIALGNVLPRARSNFSFGIRTRWTLSSERVWARTNRLGGFLLVAAGLICLAASLLPPPWSFIVAIAAITFAGLGSVIASYLFWTREQRG